MTVFAAAEGKLTKALSSVPDHARGHMYLGLVDIFTRRAEQGIAECEHALALDRNLASAHHSIGVGKTCIGHAEETEAHVVEALRLSPHDTLAYVWMTVCGRGEAPPRQLGASGRLVSPGDRGQPKFSTGLFPVGRRPRSTRST